MHRYFCRYSKIRDESSNGGGIQSGVDGAGRQLRSMERESVAVTFSCAQFHSKPAPLGRTALKEAAAGFGPPEGRQDGGVTTVFERFGGRVRTRAMSGGPYSTAVNHGACLCLE